MDNGLRYNVFYFDILRENELFADITNDALKTLFQFSNYQFWPKKTCVLDSDHTQHKFYIVISGKIKEYNYDNIHNRELIHSILSKNDYFNVCNLMNGRSSGLYYEVLTKAELLCVPMTKMRLWMKDNPIFIKAVTSYLVEKMAQLENKAFNLCSLSIPTRLAKLLIDNFNRETNKIELINGLSNSNLAGLIGTTRAVLNRHLQEFKEEGIIQIDQRSLKIVDIQLLFAKLQDLPMAHQLEKSTLTES